MRKSERKGEREREREIEREKILQYIYFKPIRNVTLRGYVSVNQIKFDFAHNPISLSRLKRGITSHYCSVMLSGVENILLIDVKQYKKRQYWEDCFLPKSITSKYKL